MPGSRRGGEDRSRIRIVLALAGPDTPELLSGVIAEDPRFELAGTVSDTGSTLQIMAERKPQALICELSLPPVGAVAMLPQIAHAVPDACSLVLVEQPFDERWFDALRAGASGLALVPTSVAEARVVADDAAAMMQGVTVLAPPAGKMLLRDLREEPPGSPRGLKPIDSILTNREWQILELIEQGLTTAEIARRFVLSEDTIYTHVANLLRKLGVHTRAEAVAAGARLLRQEAGQRHSVGDQSPGE